MGQFDMGQFGIEGAGSTGGTDGAESAGSEIEGRLLADRAAEVAELALSQYAEVRLADRLRASVGREVSAELAGGGRVDGVVEDIGVDWVSLLAGASRCLVVTDGVVTMRGLAGHAAPQAVTGALGRRSLATMLRGYVVDRSPVVVTTWEGAVLRGRVLRVGADFLELAPESVPGTGPGSVAIGLDHVLVVRCD